MILLDEYALSEWAYNECKKGNDIHEIRKLITKQNHIYHYCKFIRDIEDMWRKIKDRNWASVYCLWVKDRPEVRKYK